jgi:hypothetical protein
MTTSYRKDITSGLLLLLMGGGIVFVSLTEYRVGTFARMGPGLFPAVVGGLLALLGSIVAAVPLWKSRDQTGELPKAEWRPLIVILAALIVFYFSIRYLGLIPAVVLVTFTSAMAHPSVNFIQMAIVAAVLSATSALLFRVLLGIPFDLFSWPIQ